MKRTVITEGHVKAVKCTDTFGGVNMWRLEVKDADGHFEDVQWMGVYNIQKFFKEKLPVYKDTSTSKVELVED